MLFCLKQNCIMRAQLSDRVQVCDVSAGVWKHMRPDNQCNDLQGNDDGH